MKCVVCLSEKPFGHQCDECEQSVCAECSTLGNMGYSDGVPVFYSCLRCALRNTDVSDNPKLWERLHLPHVPTNIFT
jgi:hypothetical protein